METLLPWCDAKGGSFGVLVLGGIKKEKIQALRTLGPCFDAIIPGGIVLNTILAIEHGSVGRSVLEDDGESFLGSVRKFLKTGREKCCFPTEVIVACRAGATFVDHRSIHLDQGEKVPPDMMIVSYRFPPEAAQAMQKAVDSRGRLVIAGIPDVGLGPEGTASERLAYWLGKVGEWALILGGDTAGVLRAERATASSGGGAAIQFLSSGTTAVYEALKKNRVLFPGDWIMRIPPRPAFRGHRIQGDDP